MTHSILRDLPHEDSSQDRYRGFKGAKEMFKLITACVAIIIALWLIAAVGAVLLYVGAALLSVACVVGLFFIYKGEEEGLSDENN